MMGAAAVAVVVVCAAMYTIFEVIERRKRKKFAEDIRRYIQNHKGEWTSDNQDLQERKKQMSERMIIDALPVRNNILLGIMETKTGNVVVDAMIQSAFRACIEELDGAPVVEVPEWRRASDPPPTHNETWHDGDEVYSGETSMKVWAYCADGTQHDAHYEIHDGNGQWFVEGKNSHGIR